MMSLEQLVQTTLDHEKRIVATEESVKSAHKRLDNTDRIISSIHELARNAGEIATKIELLTDRMDKSIERIETGQKSQGARIGEIERVVHQIEHNEKELLKQGAKLEAIEREPARKWQKLSWIVVVGMVTAIVAYIMGKIL